MRVVYFLNQPQQLGSMQPPYTNNNYAHCDLRNRSFRRQDLSGASFKDSDLRGCDFTQAILTDANFELAKFGQSRQQFWVFLLTTTAIILPLFAIAIVVVLTDHLPIVQTIAMSLGYFYAELMRSEFTAATQLLGNAAMFVLVFVLVSTGILLLIFVPDNPFNLVLAIAFLGIAIYLVIKTKQPRKRTIAKNGTCFRMANLTRAKFRSQTLEQNVQDVEQIVQDVDFTGAILAQVDFGEVMFGPIQCDYFYQDQDGKMRHPSSGTLNAGEFG